jgi:hypothetical protein
VGLAAKDDWQLHQHLEDGVAAADSVAVRAERVVEEQQKRTSHL